jgi:hypothetical protein
MNHCFEVLPVNFAMGFFKCPAGASIKRLMHLDSGSLARIAGL